MTHLPVKGGVILVLAGTIAQFIWSPKPLLVWNATASAPIGLYRRSFAGLTPGAWVLLRPPSHVAMLAAKRGYLRRPLPMIKQIAAMRDDIVCRRHDVISINGRVRARALSHDGDGRSLPGWQGCQRLVGDHIFLLNQARSSFDGRYFGVIADDHVIERIEPLWTF